MNIVTIFGPHTRDRWIPAVRGGSSSPETGNPDLQTHLNKPLKRTSPVTKGKMSVLPVPICGENKHQLSIWEAGQLSSVPH